MRTPILPKWATNIPIPTTVLKREGLHLCAKSRPENQWMTQTNQRHKPAAKCSPIITHKAKTDSKICPRDLTSPPVVLQAASPSARLHPQSEALATLKKVSTRPCVRAKSLLNRRAETRISNLRTKASIRWSCTSQTPLTTQICSTSTILIRETMSTSSR